MKKITFILLIFLIVPVLALGQTLTMKKSVFFDSNKYNLKHTDKQTIENALDSLSNEIVFKIIIFGNTDNTADSIYNLKLSDRRTASVKKHLISKGIDKKIITANYFGEYKPVASNESVEGKQKNRRVDVIFQFRHKVAPKPVLVDTIPKPVINTDTCEGRDTTIILKQGTQLVFNRCEYLEIKDCLEYKETNNSASILNNGMSLMDSSGLILASCGMIKIGIKPGCPKMDHFKTPVKISFPVPINNECDFCKKNAKSYVYLNNHWRLLDKKTNGVKIVKIDEKPFYQLEAKKPDFWMNCDCRFENGNKIKFKTKRNYKIVNLKITNDCPTLVAEVKPTAMKSHTTINFPCVKGNKTVTATIIDNKGDTLILKEQPLNDLPKKIMFSKCAKIKSSRAGSFLWVFPISKKELYRKYIIKPNLLIKQ
jgi:hypothetical protein